MLFIHTIIKIKYVKEGYLPNYPPSLLSEYEMVDAFFTSESDIPKDASEFMAYMKSESVSGYLVDTYVLPILYMVTDLDESNVDIINHLNELVSSIFEICQDYKSKIGKYAEICLPNYVYSYMLGECIGPESGLLDIHDLLTLLNIDNLDDTFTLQACRSCYSISQTWIGKTSVSQWNKRVPTVFGEPIVLKSLRLDQVKVGSTSLERSGA